MTTTTAAPRRPVPTGRSQFWLEDGRVLRFRGAEVRYRHHRVRLRTPDGNRVQVEPTGEGRANVYVDLVRTGPGPQFVAPGEPAADAATCTVPPGASCVGHRNALIAGEVELDLAGLRVRYQRGRVTFVGPAGNQIDVLPSCGDVALAFVIAVTAGPTPQFTIDTTRPPGDAATPEGPGGRTGGATEPPLCRFGPGGDFAADYTPAVKTPKRKGGRHFTPVTLDWQPPEAQR